jgi:hypothetical protein
MDAFEALVKKKMRGSSPNVRWLILTIWRNFQNIWINQSFKRSEKGS